MNRTTPLRRTSSLEPGNGPEHRTPLRVGRPKRKSGKRGSSTGSLIPPAPSEFTEKVKLLVRKRAGRGDIFDAQAECCGAHLGEKAGEFQHRAARGAGGCRDAVVNGPSNCLLMCPEHHRQAEDRDRRLGMDEAGFWLEHGTTPEYDPRNAPIMLHGADGDGAPFYLAADGLGLDGSGYLPECPQEVAA